MSLDALYSPLVLFGISILIWWLILTPISIYYLLCYYRHRNNVSIRHRHWQIVLLLGTFCIFFWSIERPLELIWKLHALNINPAILYIFESIHYILFPITIHGFIWCIVWRYYMIYYNIKFYEENINMKWKIIINYNMNNIKHKTANWFLVNRKRYGSIEWLTSRISLIFLSLMSLLIFIQFYNQLIASILDGTISFFSLPILFILWYKTPIIDHFHIGMEYIYIIILCLIEWCFYFGGSLINMIFNYNQNNITFIFIQSWIGILFAFCIIIICTKWTLYKCHINCINSNNNRIPTPRNIHNVGNTSVRSLRSLSAVGSNSTIINKNHFQRKLSAISPRGKSLKLYECLQNNQGFNCFMNHLMSEFSHECLLSSIEFIQFKKCLSYSYTDVLGANQLCLPNYFNNNNNGNKSPSHLQSPSVHSDTSSSMHLDSPQQSQTPPINISILSSISADASMSKSDCNSNSNSPNISIQQSFTSLHSHILSNGSAMTNTRNEILTCQFPQCVPKSFIVFNNNENGNGNNITKENVIKEYKIKACELFEKYIFSNDNTCPYEININYDMRKKLINLMGGNKEKWVNNEISGGFEQLYTLFDPCILEMYDLMCHSFQRFKKTPQFAKLDKKIFCKSSFPDTFLS